MAGILQWSMCLWPSGVMSGGLVGSWPTSLVRFSGKKWREGMCHSLMESRAAINTITFTPLWEGG